jgi:hypothetical protein
MPQSRSLADFQTEMELLIDDYLTMSPKLSRDELLDGTADIFISQCYRRFGPVGYEIAHAGIHAILETLREFPDRD